MINMKCKICHNDERNKVIVAKEKMFGIGEEFKYLECSNCGCLQIIEIPENMDKYYPRNYYSYKNELFDVKFNLKYFHLYNYLYLSNF